MLILVLMFLGGAALLIADYVASRQPIEGGLIRNTYGSGKRTEELEVSAGESKREKIEVQVSEREYSGEELQQMFQRCIAGMDRRILGKNESLDHIESDMDLITGIDGVPVEISWELDRYDVMNVYGELQEDGLTKEGTLVMLKGFCHWVNTEFIYTN